MENLALFSGQFLKYLIMLLIIVAVAAIGFTVGLFVRKSLDKKKAAQAPTEKSGDDSNTSGAAN